MLMGSTCVSDEQSEMSRGCFVAAVMTSQHTLVYIGKKTIALNGSVTAQDASPLHLESKY